MQCLISMLHSTIYVFVLFDINVVRQFCVLHCIYDFANENLSLFIVLIIIKDINLCFVLHDIHLTRQFYVIFFDKYLYYMAILCWRTKTLFFACDDNIKRKTWNGFNAQWSLRFVIPNAIYDNLKLLPLN